MHIKLQYAHKEFNCDNEVFSTEHFYQRYSVEPC